MKVLFDTNVILDVLLDRAPLAEDAAHLLSQVERAKIAGFACATTIPAPYSLLSKALGARAADRHIHSLPALFVAAAVNRIVLEGAGAADFDDFEDAVAHEAAVHAGARYIVTRNVAEFKRAKLPVFTPREFIGVLASLTAP
ncbi:PIN domain-containing protein [Dissulfurirhabdus thermomarina]|uniref:PIN domain-containing protein n=1 Tax=Dissulfurirhabdus thermomarina TaxID=1765737 RepID=A0A6N9TQR9_DISTH|nr:PIN domain-containing protein [Dissulfurirhabdus thermomarina]NDY43621.1 PIN domain-containing protein [Dissulfurirhabdus thermomarina]